MISPLRFYRWALPVLALANVVIAFSIQRRNSNLTELRAFLESRLSDHETRLAAVESVGLSSSTSASSSPTRGSSSGRLVRGIDEPDNRPVVALDRSYHIYCAFNRARRRAEYRLWQNGHDFSVGDLTRYGRIVKVSWDCVEFDRAIGFVSRDTPQETPGVTYDDI